MDDKSKESTEEAAHCSNSETSSQEHEKKARVDAMWELMNKGVPAKTLKSVPVQAKPSLPVNKSSPNKTSHGWMNFLGMASKRKESTDVPLEGKKPPAMQNGIDEEAKKLAAAALAAVKDGSVFSTASAQGKVEVTEVRDFAGQDIEVKKLVDANSEAAEKAKVAAGPSSAVDALLEQIKKKQKLSVLDKTKKDWGEFKDDNKGVEEELDAYKKSSDQYLGRVSFLERADYREYERERDARLSSQSKRRTDTREDP